MQEDVQALASVVNVSPTQHALCGEISMGVRSVGTLTCVRFRAITHAQLFHSRETWGGWNPFTD
jgi:hypothetical protein